MYTIALILNIIQLIYHQVTTNFDFYPFNNVRRYTARQRFKEASIHGGLMFFSIIAMLLNNKILISMATIYLGLLLIGEYLSWWRHYFFMPTNEWSELYNEIFKETTIVLPKIKENPIPNLEHCILHFITLLTFVFTLKYLLLI